MAKKLLHTKRIRTAQGGSAALPFRSASVVV